MSTLRRWQYTERRPFRAGDEGGQEQEDVSGHNNARGGFEGACGGYEGVQHEEAGSPRNSDSHTFGHTRNHPKADEKAAGRITVGSVVQVP